MGFSTPVRRPRHVSVWTRVAVAAASVAVVGTFLVCLLALRSLAGAACGSRTSAAVPEPAGVQVAVRSGDTLWSIARKFSGDGRDLRRAVYRIRQVNNLDTPIIHPGQLILIPSNL
ncbi:MAG: LysM peptidoglycan-binding domain-containing protein [Firmicutes bacterium]|jgi:nucleoid-associated protein YgaU|nr:LysM peptidoglycan-binding domain-containing protein [Bacillota bacterium]